MYHCGTITYLNKSNGIIHIKNDGSKLKHGFSAHYEGYLDKFKKGDKIRYIYVYDKETSSIEIVSLDHNPIKQVWITDAFAEMSKRVTAKRQEKK